MVADAGSLRRIVLEWGAINATNSSLNSHIRSRIFRRMSAASSRLNTYVVHAGIGERSIAPLIVAIIRRHEIQECRAF